MTVLYQDFISVEFHFDVNPFILQLLKRVVIVIILYSLTYKK